MMLRSQTVKATQRVCARALHSAAVLATVPKKSAWSKYKPEPYRPAEGLEKLAHQYAGSAHNYNIDMFGAENAPATNERSNVEFTMKLLAQQLKAAGPNAKNVFVSPLTLAQSLSASNALTQLKLSPKGAEKVKSTNYAQTLEELTKSGDVTLNISSASSSNASAAFASSIAQQQAQAEALKEEQMAHLIRLPFPLNDPSQLPSSSSSAAAASSTPLTHALNFTGYLAPRFTSPETRFPNYFFDYQGQKKIAHMMVKSSKMWYVEHEKFQMIDLPYLNSGFVATLVLPRISAERTIQDHPDEFSYDQSPRTASTVHELLSLFSEPSKNGSDLFSHHAKYMRRMPGLIGLPGFQADYSVDEKAVGGSGSAAHRAALALSPHGLDVGARTPRQRGGQTEPNFTALCDHPFLFFIRSTSPKNPQILFAGVVNDIIERHGYSSKYPLPDEWTKFKEEVGQTLKKLYEKAW